MVIPRHLAIIPDGNRRFAKRLMENPWKGHEWGYDKIRNVFEWSKSHGIKILTFYILSLENMDSRPRNELDFLFALSKKSIRSILNSPDNYIHKNKVRVKCFGRIDKLPDDLQKDIKSLVECTKDYSCYHMNLAIAYGGRQEVVDACRRVGQKIANGTLSPQEINEMVIRQNLSTNGNPDPDLIIRTGGEKRLSNFLIYQSAYSELIFIDSLWPEFTEEDFNRAVSEFSHRVRRFGR